MEPRAIFLIGPAGSGKTSLGKAIQELSAGPWLFYEVDKCQPTVPSQRPDFVTPENDRALRHANLCAACAYVEAGFQTIIETGIIDSRGRDARAEVFDGVSVVTVLVVCERTTVERRTRERGARWQDWALAHFDDEHWSTVVADLQLASDDCSPADLAREVLRWLDEVAIAERLSHDEISSGREPATYYRHGGGGSAVRKAALGRDLRPARP